MGFTEKLTSHLAAGYSIVWIRTYEELRARIAIKEVADALDKTFYLWSFTIGLCKLEGEELTKIDNTGTPEEVIQWLFQEFTGEMSVFAFCDFHPFISDPLITRMVREIGTRFKEKGNNLVLLSPVFKLPEELKKDVTLIEFDLPTREELGTIVNEIAEQSSIKVKEKNREKILESLRGLTTIEAEDALALSVYNHEKFDVPGLMKTKASTIKKSGILEYFESDTTMKDVGGFPILKEWLGLRRSAFSKEAREYGIFPPKGALLIGIPGCGKSLVAKSVSSEWGFPLCKLDLGKVYGSLVGQSEENIREALKLAEAVAPSILFIDEIEKGLAGSTSGGKHDSGVTSRVFGTILNWMQDKKEEVFVIATANNISALPPEFLRKGRFDEIFFVDLPNEKEREDILKIHLRKRGRNPKDFDLGKLVDVSESFTGSEIEEVINSGLFHSFSESRELETKDLEKAIIEMMPLSKTMNVELEAIRRWSKDRAVNVSGVEKKKLRKKQIRRIARPGKQDLN